MTDNRKINILQAAQLKEKLLKLKVDISAAKFNDNKQIEEMRLVLKNLDDDPYAAIIVKNITDMNDKILAIKLKYKEHKVAEMKVPDKVKPPELKLNPLDSKEDALKFLKQKPDSSQYALYAKVAFEFRQDLFSSINSDYLLLAAKNNIAAAKTIMISRLSYFLPGVKMLEVYHSHQDDNDFIHFASRPLHSRIVMNAQLDAIAKECDLNTSSMYSPSVKKMHEAQLATGAEKKSSLTESLKSDVRFLIDKDVTPHAVLDVKEGATKEEIKAAFRSQALQWHPDRLAMASAADIIVGEEKIKIIKAAYNVISDPEALAYFKKLQADAKSPKPS